MTPKTPHTAGSSGRTSRLWAPSPALLVGQSAVYSKKRFAIDGEEGPQGLIVRQDELEDAPDDQLPPRVGERRGS